MNIDIGKTIGIMMLAIFFVSMFAAVARGIGAKQAAVGIIFSTAVTAFIVIGIKLTIDGHLR